MVNVITLLTADLFLKAVSAPQVMQGNEEDVIDVRRWLGCET